MLQCFFGDRIRCFLFILDFTYTFPTQLLLFVNFSASSSRPRSVDCKATSRSYRVKTGRLVVPITTPFPGIHKYKPHWTNGWLRGIPEVWILHSLHSQMTQTPVVRLNPCFFRQGWKYNKERGVRSFAVFRFWGGRARFCHIFLGHGWTTGLLYHSLGRILENGRPLNWPSQSTHHPVLNAHASQCQEGLSTRVGGGRLPK